MDAPEVAVPAPAAGMLPVRTSLGAELRGTALLFGMTALSTGGVAAAAHLLLGLLH